MRPERRSTRYGIALSMTVAVLLLVGCGDLAPAEPDSDSQPFERSNIEVRAGQMVTHGIEVESGHTLEFRVEASRDVNMLLLDPEVQELGSWDRADHIELNSFKAEVTGEHILEFDNSYSRLTRKSVTLLYRVLPPGEN